MRTSVSVSADVRTGHLRKRYRLAYVARQHQCHMCSPSHSNLYATCARRNTRIAVLTTVSLLLQIFGSPSTPILENPEYQTRWYFKYFLGKREYPDALNYTQYTYVATSLFAHKNLSHKKHFCERSAIVNYIK